MRTLNRISEVRVALTEARRAGRSVGLVPTMGAFHEGHLELMRQAGQECDTVVVSLFVNPTQFNEAADFAAYPRDVSRDAVLAAEAGVDFLFLPSPDEVYPPGFCTTVNVGGVAERMEGAHRGRSHFEGVATVVLKLLNIVGPDVAFFGQKDAQQAAVIQRLVADLNVPVRIEIVPTTREPDGLAMSSRNVRLTEADRLRAPALSRALRAVAEAIAAGERDVKTALAAGHAVLSEHDIQPDYLELVDARSLEPLDAADRSALVLVAARLGDVRLIDNLPVTLVASPVTAK